MTEYNTQSSENAEAVNTAHINAELIADKEKKAGFRRICGKIGLSISLFYICKIAGGMLVSFLYEIFHFWGTTALYGLGMVFSCIFSYLIPLLAAVILFGSEDTYGGGFKQLYKLPKNPARVFSAFPAIYAMGQAVNILTLLAFYLISFFSHDSFLPERSFQNAADLIPENIYCALILAAVSVIAAPLAEEFWVRGIFYDALKPYGNGIAIVITSIVFGLMHGNLQMLFYTTALGFALGYIRYATGSLFASTLIHAGVNFISAGISVFLSLETFKKVNLAPSEGEQYLSVLFYAYLGVVLVLIIIGIGSFFKRLPAVRRGGIKNSWSSTTPAKKLLMFLTSLPVLAMLALAFDAHAGQWISMGLYKLLQLY